MEEVGFPSQAMDSERNGRRCECGTEGLDADRSPRTTDDIKTASFVASSWATAVCPHGDNLNIRRTIKGKNRGPDSTRFPHRAAGEEPGYAHVIGNRLLSHSSPPAQQSLGGWLSLMGPRSRSMLPVSLPFNLAERRVHEGAIGQPLGTSSARTFRTPRSRKKLASGSAISKVVLNPAAMRWSDPSFPSSRITASVSPSAPTSIFLSTTGLFSPQMQYMSRSLVQALLCKYASL